MEPIQLDDETETILKIEPLDDPGEPVTLMTSAGVAEIQAVEEEEKPKIDMCGLVIGRKFDNFDELHACVTKFQRVNNVHLYIRSSRKLYPHENALRASLNDYNPKLQFGEIYYACVRGGRRFRTSESSPVKQINCPFNLKVRLTRDAQFLFIKDFNPKHNHALDFSQGTRRTPFGMTPRLVHQPSPNRPIQPQKQSSAAVIVGPEHLDSRGKLFPRVPLARMSSMASPGTGGAQIKPSILLPAPAKGVSFQTSSIRPLTTLIPVSRPPGTPGSGPIYIMASPQSQTGVSSANGVNTTGQTQVANLLVVKGPNGVSQTILLPAGASVVQNKLIANAAAQNVFTSEASISSIPSITNVRSLINNDSAKKEVETKIKEESGEMAEVKKEVMSDDEGSDCGDNIMTRMRNTDDTNGDYEPYNEIDEDMDFDDEGRDEGEEVLGLCLEPECILAEDDEKQQQQQSSSSSLGTTDRDAIAVTTIDDDDDDNDDDNGNDVTVVNADVDGGNAGVADKTDEVMELGVKKIKRSASSILKERLTNGTELDGKVPQITVEQAGYEGSDVRLPCDDDNFMLSRKQVEAMLTFCCRCGKPIRERVYTTQNSLLSVKTVCALRHGVYWLLHRNEKKPKQTVSAT